MPFEYHKGSNLPFDTALLSPPNELLFLISRVVINVSCNSHAHCIECIAATDNDEKFNSSHNYKKVDNKGRC